MEPHEAFPVRDVVENPGEKIFVHVRAEDGLGFGFATAYIRHSDHHVHNDGIEIYIVVRGAIRLELGDQHSVVLEKGHSYTISKGQCHYAVQEGRVLPAVHVYSFPAWTRDDHTKCKKHKD